MSYGFYKVLHLLGVLSVFMALGGVLIHAMSTGQRRFPGRRWAMVFHGVGLLIVFVAGFGLMARIGIMDAWPLWIWLKLVIWFVLGGMVYFIFRKPQWATALWVLALVVGGLAAFLANYKPL